MSKRMEILEAGRAALAVTLATWLVAGAILLAITSIVAIARADDGDTETDVVAGVRPFCAAKWPDKYRMRDFCETRHLEAGAAYLDILEASILEAAAGAPVRRAILRRCRQRWTKPAGVDWPMVIFCFEREDAAYQRVGG